MKNSLSKVKKINSQPVLGKLNLSNISNIPANSWKFKFPNWLGYYALICGILSIIGWFTRHGFRFYILYWVDSLLGLGGLQPAPSLSEGVLFLFLAALCFLRKKIAVFIFIILEVIAIIWSIVYASRFFEPAVDNWLILAFEAVGALVSLGMVYLLLSALPVFVGRIKIIGLLRGLVVFLTAQIALLFISFFMINFTPIRSYLDPSISLLAWIFHQMVGIPYELRFLVPDISQYHALKPVGGVIGLISALITLVAVLLFFSGRNPAQRSLQEDIQLRELLAEYGSQDSLSYYATRDDRAIVFSLGGKAAVSFGTAAGVALAAGDPIGDRNQWACAIHQWHLYCYANGYIPAVISASESGARAYRKAGLRVRSMGDEAVIKPAEMDLHRPFFRPLMDARRRANRHGIEIKIARQVDLEEAELKRLYAAANQYRNGEERGFSMALDRFFAPQDEQQMIVYAVDKTGSIQALLSFVPWGRHGISLNLMRRSRDSLNGIIEAMIVNLIEHSPELAIKKISLNFAMFRGAFVAGKSVDASFLERLEYRFFLAASHIWQLESLYKSNARYAPDWESRYFCLPIYPLEGLTLFAAGILEGFVSLPGILRRRPTLNNNPLPLYLEEVRRINRYNPFESVEYSPSEQVRIRLAKLERLRQAGRDPYPAGMQLGQSVTEIASEMGIFDQEKAPVFRQLSEPKTNPENTVVAKGRRQLYGRIVARRNHGGVVFYDLYGQGQILQVIFERNLLSARDWQDSKLLDLGDTLTVWGELGESQKGTPSVIACSWQLLSKALRPSPHPRVVLDRSTRSRQRTLTLRNDISALGLVELRSRALMEVRQSLIQEGFIEVETPMLHAVQGGANARPFITHANSYGCDVFLRIAPELYLKRLAIAGMGAIFEIGRSFRNESADLTHNPEFTSLEAYRVGADYEYMRLLTEKLFKAAARRINGGEIVYRPVSNREQADTVLGGQFYCRYDISKPWPKIPVYQAVSEAIGEEIDSETEIERLHQLCVKHGIEVRADADAGAMVTELYEELVEAKTEFPTFYCDFPVSTSPLTRRHRKYPELAERWDLVAFGMELGTAYTELTDPVDQRERFTAQSMAAAAGDPEAMSLDEGFLQDLELGLLPTGGLGIGMDRLVMFLTGSNIRQIMAFPFVRSQG